MSTPAWKKRARQEMHLEQKKRREYDKLFGSVKATKKEFVEYEAPKPFVRNTTQYRSLTTSNIPGACAKRESQRYTGDLIVGIATMHKSNAVPVMRGTEQAKEIASMRR